MNLPYTFVAGTKAKAQEVNANFRAIVEEIGTLANSVTSGFANIQEDLESEISDLESDISETNTALGNLTTTVNGKLSATIKTTSFGIGCKLSNGFIFNCGRQSGMGNGTSKTITLPIPYSSASNYSVGGSTNYVQSAGDKRSSWYVNGMTSSKFVLNSRFEQSSSNTIYWLSIGK